MDGPFEICSMMASSNGKKFPRYWTFVRGIPRSPVNSPHKGQWRGALMVSLICTWINGWVNNPKAGALRRHRAHYDVIAMLFKTGIDYTECVVYVMVQYKHQICLFAVSYIWFYDSVRDGHYNGSNGVSNYWRLECLFNRVFRLKWKRNKNFLTVTLIFQCL